MSEIFVGIDLGTTNTLACYLKKGKPELIHFPGSGKMIPSVLYIDEAGKVSVGKRAKISGSMDPLNAIHFSTMYATDVKKIWKIGGKEFTFADVVAEILKEVKAQILIRLRCMPYTDLNAVIAVPSYLTNDQKDEIRKAATIAGIYIINIITEPKTTAVAVCSRELGGKIFVVDFGYKTFNITALKKYAGTYVFDTLGTYCDTEFGGDDFDTMIYNYLIGIIQDDLGLDLSDQKKSGLDYNEYYSMTWNVRKEAERAKIELFSDDMTTYEAQIFLYNGKSYDFSLEITRENFDDICQPLYDKITSRIKNFIETNDKFKLSEISTIILSGNTFYIPKLQEEVEKIFGKKAADTTQFEELNEIAVLGASIIAESINI